MRPDVRDAERARVGDQGSEDAVSGRKAADLERGLRVDAERLEAGERGAIESDDADRGVARSGQIGGGLQRVTEHRVEIELGDEGARRIEQPPQARIV